MGNAPDVKVRLSAEGQAEVIAAFRQVSKEAEQSGRRGARGFSVLGGELGSLRRLLPGLGFAAAAAGALALARQSLQTADGLAKLSRQTGVSVETLSAYSHGADLSGISTEDLATALARLARRMNDAAQGSQEAQRTFGGLDIPIKNTDGSLRSLEDVLGDVAERFSAMPDGPRKAALAMEIFGRSGARLIPFLNNGRAGLAEFRAEAERLGLVFDTQTAIAAEQLNDNFKRLQGTVRGFVNRELAALLPLLNDLAIAMLDSADAAAEAGVSIGQG